MTPTFATDAAEAIIPVERPVTVLLIDDQAIVGEAVRRMLAPEADVRFHFCQDPTKAIETANAVQPTVILQDLVMPEIDGLQLVKFFRANKATRETPMIVLSSKEEPVVKARAFAVGANDYLVKLPDQLELLVRDDKEDSAAVTVEKPTLKRGDALAIDLRDGGGFVARFSRK